MKSHFKGIQTWNIVFLIYAELFDNATPDPGAGADNVPIQVQLKNLEAIVMEMTLYNHVQVFYIKNSVLVSNNVAYSDTTLISKLKIRPGGKGNEFKVIEQLSRKNFAQKEQCIEAAFRVVEKESTADKTLLITWDHGSAFGIFKKTVKDHTEPTSAEKFFADNYVIIAQKEIDADRTFCVIRNKPLKRQDYKSAPESNHADADSWNGATYMDILSNDHLADSITQGFSSGFVEALMMYNCDMQNIHTCYSMRNCVRYLIAPEAAIASPGYDYQSIIEFIGRNPNAEIDGSMIAVQAIETLTPYYTLLGQTDTLNMYAIFGVSLKDYDQKIVRFMRAFADKMIKLMANKDLQDNMVITREKCYDFGDNFTYFLVDFQYFLKKLVQVEPKFSDVFNYFEVALKSVIVAQIVGNDLYPTGGSTQKGENAPLSGMTIYFPDEPIDKTDDIVKEYILPNSPYSSSVIKAIHWIAFINKMYETATSSQI